MESEGLDRFLEAQEGVYDQALAEIRAGAKRSHWMWFIFPQLRGLGQSAMAVHYGVDSRAEAVAYLAHPILGARLRTAVEALMALPSTGAERVFGAVDAMKLRSSLTLFEAAATDDTPFGAAIDRWFGGERDARTLTMLAVP